MVHLLQEVLRNSILITCLVIIMMLGIEYINVGSGGKWFARLQGSKPKQVLLGSLLGLIPGCIGGFAAVSLYAHRLLSFGALVAMMICSSGDEAFVMLAMIPKQALLIFLGLFAIAVVTGLLVDKFFKKPLPIAGCDQDFEIHHHDEHHHTGLPSPWKRESYYKLRHASRHKIILLVGITAFIIAMLAGLLEHDHSAHVHDIVEHEHALSEHNHTAGHAAGHVHTADCNHLAHNHSTDDAHAVEQAHATDHHPAELHEHGHAHKPAELHTHDHTMDIFSERWLNIAFAILSLGVLFLTMTASEHFVEEHIWNHVIRKHFLSIFLWTFGALTLIQVGLQYLDIEHWIRSNIPFMIILAALIGIIPESGPHMIFISLYATGMVPVSVLLASSIAQDGHTTLPLLAQSKRSFVRAKLINIAVAIITGMIFWLFNA